MPLFGVEEETIRPLKAFFIEDGYSAIPIHSYHMRRRGKSFSGYSVSLVIVYCFFIHFFAPCACFEYDLVVCGGRRYYPGYAFTTHACYFCDGGMGGVGGCDGEAVCDIEFMDGIAGWYRFGLPFW